MTEEEKKAIENLIKSSTYSNYDNRNYPNCICFEKDVVMILNLIQKQQKEIEILKEEKQKRFLDFANYYEFNKAVDVLNRFIKDINVQMHPVTTQVYREEIKNAIKNIIDRITISISPQLLEEKQKELERKDKIIDEMAEAMENNYCSIEDVVSEIICDKNNPKRCTGTAMQCKDCIKQYFLEKVEDK